MQPAEPKQPVVIIALMGWARATLVMLEQSMRERLRSIARHPVEL
jgi:hypothetical protein